MSHLKPATFILLLTIAFAAIGSSQTIVSSTQDRVRRDANDESRFVALKGGFSISIDASFGGYSGLRLADSGQLGVGGLHIRRTGDARYHLGYINLSPTAKTLKPAEIRAGLIAFQNKLFGVTINNLQLRDGRFKTYSTIEGTGEFGVTYFFRYILTTETIFVLIAETSSPENGPSIMKVFDTWSQIPQKEITAKKLADATPSALPQMPIVARPTTDAIDEGLKGPVESVIETEEDLTGTWYSVGPVSRFDRYFGKAGNLTKSISYTNDGFPMEVIVFGFIDGMRVEKSGWISYETSLSAISSVTRTKPAKTPDARFSRQLKYEYDNEKRLTSEIWLDNAGELSWKTEYEYVGGNREVRAFDSDNKLVRTESITLDNAGNEIASVSTWMSRPSEKTVSRYKYEAFDRHGNWLRMLVESEKPGPFGQPKIQRYFRHRKITYYE